MTTKQRNYRLYLIRKAKVGQRDLGLEGEAYRGMLFERYGVESCAELSIDQLKNLIVHYSSLGMIYKSSDQTQHRDYYHIPHDVKHASQKRKIAAMWNALDWKMSGLDVRCKSQFGVDKFLWLDDQKHLQTLGRDLANRCTRRGIDTRGL